jgi:hypothetical protein
LPLTKPPAALQEANDKSGKPYYKYEILTRTGATMTQACTISSKGHHA